jgi:hypothetical protein
MRHPASATKRLVAALVFCTLAWTAAACGDSGDDSTTESADAPPAATSTGPSSQDTTAQAQDDAQSKEAESDGTQPNEAPPSDGADSDDTADTSPPADGASDAEQAKAVVEGMYADLASGDATGV